MPLERTHYFEIGRGREGREGIIKQDQRVTGCVRVGGDKAASWSRTGEGNSDVASDTSHCLACSLDSDAVGLHGGPTGNS